MFVTVLLDMYCTPGSTVRWFPAGSSTTAVLLLLLMSLTCHSFSLSLSLLHPPSDPPTHTHTPACVLVGCTTNLP